MIVSSIAYVEDQNHIKCVLRRQRIIADKREIRDFPQLPPVTSFIRKTLYDIPPLCHLKKEIL